MATHEMTLDLDKSCALAAEIVTARVGDGGTTIRAALTRDGRPLEGAEAASFHAVKPDRTYADQEAEVSGGVASVTLDPRFLSAPGMVKVAYFRVMVGGRAETTPDIWINVLPDAESAATSPTGPYVSEVEALTAQLEELKAKMQAAEASASGAAGAASEAASDAAAAASDARAAAQGAGEAASAASDAAGSASAAAESASAAASEAASAAEEASGAAGEARQAAEAASGAAGGAEEAAAAATSAAGGAESAAAGAQEAAQDAASAAAEARAAAGMVSADKTIFMGYETVGEVDYLTLTDQGED